MVTGLEGKGATLDLNGGEAWERSSTAQVLVCEEGDFLRRPSGLVAVRHVHGNAEVLGSFREGESLHVTVERIGEIVGSVDKEHGHGCRADIARGVPEVHPALALFRGHAAEAWDPRAVVMEETAAVNWNSDFETRINAGHDAGEVSTPADAGDAGAFCIHLGKASNERMRFHGCGNGVVGPLFGGSEIDAAKLFFVALVGTTVFQTGSVLFVVGILSVVRAIACGVHRDCGVPLFCPELGPLAEGGSATPVDEYHGGKLFTVRGSAFF